MRTKRPSLKRIAAYINANMPGYTAKIVEGYCDTDRPCGRLRIPGAGRYGNHLIVTNDRLIRNATEKAAGACGRKIKHATYSAALAHLVRLPDGEGMRVYKCLICTGYHVGHIQ